MRGQKDTSDIKVVSYWTLHRSECLALAALLIIAAVLELSQVDLVLGDYLYRWEGGSWSLRSNFWTQVVLHDGAKAVLQATMLALLLWVLSRRAKSWGQPIADMEVALIAIVLSVALISLLKHVSNVSCPWGLLRYGGEHPYVPIFSFAQTAELGACFPAGHASAGYGLLAFYFLAKQRGGRGKWFFLVLALSLGLILDFAQQLRGAHFVSHGLWTLIVVCIVNLLVFALFHSKLQASNLLTARPRQTF